LRRAALRELCTLHSELDDAGRALPYLQAYIADELDRVDERRTRWVELFGRRKSLLETERAAGQLRRQAYEDPLTHLPNRRYAEARLDGLLSAGSVPALAVVDVDRFKSINDALGHPGGDAVLRTVADLLVAGVRDTDEVCRWAGDEFVVLLPETTAEQAERALERIRRAIAGHDWAAIGLDGPVTISVGIASAARGDDRRTLFAAADGVLYDAKRSGRDRVVRLSAVTQTRAGDTPPARREEVAPDVRADVAGFATLLTGPAAGSRPDPLLYRGTPTDPPLGPIGPVPAPAVPPAPDVRAERPDVRAERPRGAADRGGDPQAGVVRAGGRSTEQVLALVRDARREHPDRPAVVLRASAETLVELIGEHGAGTTIDASAHAAAVGPLPEAVGRVAVLCAEGADAAVAAEAAFAARVSGTDAVRFDDVAGGRLTDLVADPAALEGAGCLVVVTGPDASLAVALAAATDLPVVAVPTTAGRPGALAGLGALMAVLDAGIPATEVDNGHAAGTFAAKLARRIDR
jgi:diguanylate cyclase (GGDEF)-like protein